MSVQEKNNDGNCDLNEWTILSDIYQILVDANVLNPKPTATLVNFKFPDEIMNLIDLSVPKEGTTPENIRKICETVIKYSLKTSHPHFHNQLFGAVDPYGLSAAWITDALNTSQYTFEVAPVFTIMENEVIQSCCKYFGYERGDGIFTPGGSISNMYGMVLARYKSVPNVKTAGCFGLKPLVAFTSDQSHYSIQKAVHWLGIGTDNLIRVKSNEIGCMLVKDLEENIERVIRSNRLPFFVNATAGTTVLGAFDDLEQIAIVCEKYNLWLHVDCCLGGSIIFSHKHKYLLKGINRSNSLSWNPHKSLGVPLQCSMFLVKEHGLLTECNSAAATYLFQQDKFYDVSYDTGDKSIQCGRKVDVFKFWLMLKARGTTGFERLIDNSMEKAQYLTQQISERAAFRLVLRSFQYTNVSFWYIPSHLRSKSENESWWNELYRTVPIIKQNMVRGGSIMVNYAPLPSKNIGNFFRMTLTCFPPPTETSIDYLLDEIERIAKLSENLYYGTGMLNMSYNNTDKIHDTMHGA
ncbi:cysteine sulfinic acid decarboxylase [Sitodiplosis mosellana]|uniref:cysteine sulfinic acid decarboxylase n=1 Tax=Sitodiplosis mosellana TaxID=263140 RepID=UPI002443FCF2|nr:cysteine sulfinic acid decarboxylase [Sitodiplosis mosellana]XP_055305529.1 cysteine sulfinic acid decarboxylase [Sitodiplosis mosellana]XP_055305530.1 cysteine sulfinic acid decarboxylase [Sitodiplosis mosellana]XP_055305531.1 cysteine sulfinic acid decarboxylase [Sitodiplosis mosellana]